MKTTSLLTLLVAGLAFAGLRAEDAKKEELKDRGVRVAFVPGSKPLQGEADFKGAAWSALKKGGPGGADA
jgi:hypothetical protein